jgi:hypothetical protein
VTESTKVVPCGSCKKTKVIVKRTNGSFYLSIIREKPSKRGLHKQSGAVNIRKILTSKRMKGEFFIQLPYKDGIDERRVRIFKYMDGEWRVASATQWVDAKEGVVIAKLGVLSDGTLFSLMQVQQQFTLDNAKVYPNPFRVKEAFEGKLKFRELPPSAKIKIINLAGEKIIEGFANDAGEWDWKGVDESGNRVASGLYIYILEANGERKCGKIVLIR